MPDTHHAPSTYDSKPDLTESADFRSMRGQDAYWSGSRLVVVLVVTLTLAISFIYFISGLNPNG